MLKTCIARTCGKTFDTAKDAKQRARFESGLAMAGKTVAFSARYCLACLRMRPVSAVIMEVLHNA